MASYYIPLPASEYPRNALLDFSPIRQAAQDWRQSEQQDYERRRQQEQMMYERRRNAISDARSDTEWKWKQEDRDLPQVDQVGNSLIEYNRRTGQARPIYTAPDPFANIFSGLTSGPTDQAPSTNNEPTFQQQSFLPPVPDSSTPYFSRVGDEYVTSSPNRMPQGSQPNTMPTAPVIPVNSQSIPPPQNQPPQQVAQPQRSIDWSKIDDATALKMMQDPRYKEIGKMALEQRAKVNSGGLSKETANAVQKDMYETSEGLSAILGIKDTYKKEFTYWQKRLEYAGYHYARKMNIPLSPDQIKEYAQYTTWQRKTLDNVNKTIQRVTGASMGVQEAGRIMATVPNMDDDDLAFESKMKDVEKTLRTAMLRYRFYMTKGFFANGGNKEMMAAEMSIDQFREYMNDRKAQIADDLRMKNPKIEENSLKEQVGRRLRQEFGAQDI